MKKLLLIFTIIFMSALLVSGIYDPSSPLMWLASTAPLYAYIRGAIIAVLIVLLVTNPPRSKEFRLSVGIFSAVLLCLSLYFTFNFQMGMTDGFSLMEVAIVCGIEALEMETMDLVGKFKFLLIRSDETA